MKQARAFPRISTRVLAATAVSFLVLCSLLLYKLGSLTGGVSHTEVSAAHQIVGWQGILDDPLFLPLKIVRSVVFSLSSDHGQVLTRLPNVLFGAFAMLSFTTLVYIWHGARSALLAGLLFVLSAWTLHASRLASFDVLYLWAVPTLLLTLVVLQRFYRRPVAAFGSIAVLGLLLYIPGMIWLLGVAMYAYRRTLLAVWRHYAVWWQQLLLALTGLMWLPLLLYRLVTDIHMLKTWLGLPQHLANFPHLAKGLVAVPLHLFVRGPQYPEIWLGKAPILDIFTLTLSIIGIYFYLRHSHSSRSKLLIAFFGIGTVLIALNGPVTLSLLTPILYLTAATGMTYLLHEWFKTFPVNPLARGLGLSLIVVAVTLSCVLNSRAYFVAWPHNAQTKATFQNHL